MKSDLLKAFPGLRALGGAFLDAITNFRDLFISHIQSKKRRKKILKGRSVALDNFSAKMCEKVFHRQATYVIGFCGFYFLFPFFGLFFWLLLLPILFFKLN